MNTSSSHAARPGTTLLGAVVSASALLWLLTLYGRPPDVVQRELVVFGIFGAAIVFAICWSTIVGYWAKKRIWSPPWTVLAGALPFFILVIWSLFFGPFAVQLPNYLLMLVMVGIGSFSGRLARKKAYPQFSTNDSTSDTLPPPTLFPK